jgi:hypothetical protein
MADREKAQAFTETIADICASLPLRGSWEPDDRIAYAMASFRFTQDHYKAMSLLVEHGPLSWFFALDRPAFQAGLRTAWILTTASQSQMKGITRGREFPLLSELCGGTKEQSGASFSGRHHGVLGNLTHGGARALVVQFAEGAKQERPKAVKIALVGVALARAMRSQRVLADTMSSRLSSRSSLRSTEESRLIPPWREAQEAHLEEAGRMRIGMLRPSLRNSVTARIISVREELGPSTPCSWNYACK